MTTHPLDNRASNLQSGSHASHWAARTVGIAPLFASAYAIMAGCLVLLGWSANVQQLKRFVPDSVAMNPTTAIAAILSAIALIALRSSTSATWRLTLGRACAAVVVILAVARIVGLLAGWDSGVDTILFPTELKTAAGDWRDRMAPNSALACLLTGVALLSLDHTTRRGRRPIQQLSMAVIFVTLVALVGHAYGSDRLYGLSGRMGMALPTATSFLLLGIGVLCARPEGGIVGLLVGATPGGVVARWLLPAVLGVPVTLGWLRLAGQRVGYYDTSTGTALFVVAIIVVFGGIIHAGALAIDRADAERRHAEARMRETEAFLDSIIENVPNMVFVKEAGGLRFVRINRAGEELLGMSREALLGRSDFDFFPREQAQHFADRDRETLAGNTIIDIPEEPIQTPHRGARTLHTKKVAIVDAEGRARYLLGISEDITEKRQVEQELHRSRAVFANLFESLPGPYLVLDPNLRIVTANHAYLEATMTTREGLCGRDLFDAFPDNPNDPTADGTTNLRASLARVRTRRVSDTMAIQKYDVRQPDGVFVERYWSPINSPVFGADGQIEYILHRVEDVTEFVLAKKRASDESTAFEVKMQQVEAEIFRSSQQVQAANRRLEAANTALESFSYSVSHDLRAPLRHISGFAELLAQKSGHALDASGRRYVEKIGDGAKRMGILIDDLLSFSRMSRTELCRSPVALESVVADVVAELQEQSAGRAIEWRVGLLPVIDADESMLRRVFTNLLGNAVKYSSTRASAVIEVGTMEGGAGQAVVFVRDNGVGFDMAYAGRLFGVFQRLHRTEEFEGTGVGLASVRRIVERHGGSTWAEGRVDKGAVFFVSLPIHAEEQRCAS